MPVDSTPDSEATVSQTRKLTIWIVALGLLSIIGCASAEPESDLNDSDDAGSLDIGEPDTDEPDTNPPDAGAPDVPGPLDGGPETDVADDDAGEPDVFDPCDECADHEVCAGTECIDPCLEEGRECGFLTWEGDDYDCGGCPSGACSDGQCPDICEDFSAECGQVYWNGSPQDCGDCSDPPRCMHNQCTANSGFVDLVAGHSHSCGLRPNGEARCWGRNESGQLGDNNLEPASTPQWVHQLNNARGLGSQNHHSCAVGDDDHLWCWGRNESGQLGSGMTEHEPSPVQATGVIANAVATGGAFSCAVLDAEKILCWGDNEFGQLGRGTKTSEPDGDKQRVRFPTNEEFDQVVQISLGSGHTCAVRRDNSLWCWGLNQNGQLGHGDNHDGPSYATEVTDMDEVQLVSSGFQHTCAIEVGGDLWCWGHGNFGTLGNGEETSSNSPVSVALPQPVIDVASGRFHTCAALDNGHVYCWGRNNSGQIAKAPIGGSFAEPQLVEGLDDAHRVIAGDAHSCALERDGQAHCWGGNDHGQLGDGTESTRVSPTPVVQ